MTDNKSTNRPPVVPRTASVSVPGNAPPEHMTETEPVGVADFTKREIDAGAKANDTWNKRRQAELDLGKKLSGRR